MPRWDVDRDNPRPDGGAALDVSLRADRRLSPLTAVAAAVLALCIVGVAPVASYIASWLTGGNMGWVIPTWAVMVVAALGAEALKRPST